MNFGNYYVYNIIGNFICGFVVGVYNYLNFCLINDDKVYIFPTKLELRPDVNNYIGDGADYRYAGFEAYVPSKYSYLFEECSFAFLSRDPAGVKTLYAEEE